MSDLVHASGILFTDPDGRVLLMRRVDAGNFWSIPGGLIEPNETAEQAALRETVEETGVTARSVVEANRRIKDGVDFTAFAAQVDTAFDPHLNDEHDSYVWISPDDALARGGLHPGLPILLIKPEMDELDLARAMAINEVASPATFHGLTLQAMRITGTGASYRDGLDEYVWRDPSFYLNDDFLARCNGLPVILEHPEADRLNGAEFRARVIGSVVLPYIVGNEVWGIARIQDDIAAILLREHELSTSPAVIFRAGAEGKRERGANGETILIENEPDLLDHLAVCTLGVWDKGGPARGILSTSV